jgi:endoglucanase
MNNRSFFQKSLLVTVVMLVQTFSLYSQNTSYNIRINQVGFLPNSIKRAAVVNSQADSFRVMTSAMDATVYKGQVLPSVNWAASGEDVKIADFTLLKSPGRYVIVVDGLGKSVPFSIGDRVFTDISKASIKAFYYNRASMPILSEYAGKYARKEGHPDTAVIVLPSAASANRPAGTVISTPGGWYDAGDYNKYIVNSGILLSHCFRLMKHILLIRTLT